MDRTLRPGDVLMVSPAGPEEISRGDVVAFRRTGPGGDVTIVAHRVQSRTEAGFTTRGDSMPSPDVESLHPTSLIGRVHLVQRGNQIRPVWGGRAGQLWASYVRLCRQVARWARRPYNLLRASGLVHRLWKPRLVQVHLGSGDGRQVKYIHRGRAVARWWPEEGRFWCRKPYDLVIAPPIQPPTAAPGDSGP